MRKITPKSRHKYWMCPYFKWDGDLGISGECGVPSFPDEETANNYMNHYCANADWDKCSLALELGKFYERLENGIKKKI